MNCHRVQKKLPFYLDSDLSWIERKRVQHHLKSCPDCQTELQKYKAVSDLTTAAIKTDEDQNTPENLWETLQYRLPKTEPERKAKFQIATGRTWKKWTPALIGVATVLIFSLFFRPEKQTSILSQISKSPKPDVPVVEEVFQEGVTVMTFETADPTIKIVWFFFDSEKQTKPKGGVS